MRISGNDRGAMNTLQKSQTGRKLLAEAEKRGVKIEFKPDNGDSTMGQYNPNTNTISVEHGNIEKMTEVLGHELLHATTAENGNSMKEEKMAFIMGEQIAQEAGVNKNPHDASYWNNHVDRAYTGLKNDNGIMSALQALDLAAGQGTPGNAATNNMTNYGANQTNPAANAANTNNTANTGNTADAANNPFNLANNNPLQGQNHGPKNGFMQMMMQFMMMMMQMMFQMMQGQTNNQKAEDPQNLNQQQNNLQNPFQIQAFNFTA